MNRKYKYINCFCFVLFFIFLQQAGNIFAQDIHFSQFYFSPVGINPANTGNFQGDYRYTGNYKNQWNSVANPYKTIFSSFEISLPAKMIGIGVSFYTDKAGKSNMGITQGNLSASYTWRANGKNNFIGGLQYGFGQRSIKVNGLKWDSQFNGSEYDNSLASGENSFSGTFVYMDVSAGVIWNYFNSFTHFQSTAGLAVFHANKPKQSFYNNSPEKLNPKIVAHLSQQIKLGDQPLYILPQFFYSRQGTFSEVIMGGMVKYVMGFDNASFLVNDAMGSTSAILLGGQYRYKDAITLTTAYELKKALLIGMSYDINTSRLKVASSMRGGFEIALMYKGAFN